MKYYLIVGEASGDMHAANLMKELKQMDPDAEFRFCGGDKMQAVGGTRFYHYKEHNYMGFYEVAKHLRKIMNYLKLVKEDIKKYDPDMVVLVDYPGFNLRIAEFAKGAGYPVHYYISPQLWAWKEGRIKKVKAFIDQLYCIVPFEQEFYAKHNYEVKYVGNPLLDEIEHFQPAPIEGLDPNKKVIALLPGSREMELNAMLETMLKVVDQFPHLQPVIAGVPSLGKEQYDKYTKGKVPVIYSRTYDLLQHSHLALVTSGTATLETALFNVPQVVCYKASKITYWLAKTFVEGKINYISLVNLILDRPAIPEIIQNDLTKERLIEELAKIDKGPEREAQLKEYEGLRKILGQGGASKKVAEGIMDYAKEHLGH